MTMNISDDDWKRKLTPEQYQVLRQGKTEYPGTGELLHNNKTGEYRCAACGNVVFESGTKYESTVPGLIGWPAFSEAAGNDAVELKEDNSLGMSRTEIVCKNCGSHLGHLFDDPSSPNGQHYCINSASLAFEEKSDKKN
jgi:peptide-methionine (R)-S-oxide reductase